MRPHLAARLACSLTACLLAALILSACGEEQAAPAAIAPVPTATFQTYLPLRMGTVGFEAQLAVTQGEMSRGLMYRTDLGPEQGMLFVFPEPKPMSFWMANTPLNLDIGFFDAEGRLLEVHTMFAYDTTQTKSRSQSVKYALEMRDGWFARHQLRPGAVLDPASLQTALLARGVRP